MYPWGVWLWFGVSVAWYVWLITFWGQYSGVGSVGRLGMGLCAILDLCMGSYALFGCLGILCWLGEGPGGVWGAQRSFHVQVHIVTFWLISIL